MSFSKTGLWAFGILVMFFFYGLNRGLFLLKAKHTVGTSIGSHQISGRNSGGGRTFHVRFVYENYVYEFWTSRFAACEKSNNIPVIFDPNDPKDAYEYSFGGFWLWGLIWIAIIFVPWSAASLSIVGSNERLVIGRKKLGLEKVPAKY